MYVHISHSQGNTAQIGYPPPPSFQRKHNERLITAQLRNYNYYTFSEVCFTLSFIPIVDFIESEVSVSLKLGLREA